MTKLVETPAGTTVATPADAPASPQPAPLGDGWQREYKLRSWVWEVFGLTLDELCTGHSPEGWR